MSFCRVSLCGKGDFMSNMVGALASREVLEEKYLKLLMATEVAPLCKSMAENEGVFSFISDRELSTTGGKLNFQCDKVSKRVSAQLKKYDNLIEALKGLEGVIYGDWAQNAIVQMVTPLKDYAIKYGYCEQAEELIKVIRNKDIVGEVFASCDSKEDVLKILDYYGKRGILEGDGLKYKDRADTLMVDVACGYYGDKAKTQLSQDKMENAFTGATVVRGDMVFKTDGTHEWKTKNKA